MPGHIHEAEPQSGGEVQVRETEIDGNTAPLLFFQAVGIDARQRFDQRGLAVVDVSGCAGYDVAHARRSHSTSEAAGVARRYRTMRESLTLFKPRGKIAFDEAVRRGDDAETSSDWFHPDRGGAGGRYFEHRSAPRRRPSRHERCLAAALRAGHDQECHWGFWKGSAGARAASLHGLWRRPMEKLRRCQVRLHRPLPASGPNTLHEFSLPGSDC